MSSVKRRLPKKCKWLIYFGLFAAFCLDRFAKGWAQEQMHQIACTSWFDLVPFANTGALFGIPLNPIFLLVGGVIAFGLLVTTFFTPQKPIFFIPIFSLFLGASSNLFDRLRYGYVIDYLSIFCRSVWNIADLLVILGVLLFLIHRRVDRNTSPLVP